MVIEPERHILDVWAIKLASGCNDAVAHSTNEEELRLFLHGTIIEAMEALHGIPRHSATAERNPLKGSRERYDNLYGGVAVEFEWDMGRARREHGADQALGYLSQLRKDIGDSEAFTTVVCDGKQWGFLSIDPQLDRTLFDTTPATKAEYFDWAPNDVSSCRRFLELIGSYRKRPVTNATLKSSFGPSSETTRLLVTLLVENLRGRAFDDRPDVLYKEWRRALDVVYGDLDHPDEKLEEVVAATYGLTSKGGVGESLFVLHTYFAFVTRLFAYEILGIATDDRTSRPSSWVAIPEVDLLERLTEMDQGILPGGLVIHNLFEPDVFSWWLDEARGSFDLVNAIREILSILSDFAFPRLVHGPQRATDVLSGLYQALVGKELRKKLGEFLTPRWLAEAGLNRLKESGAPLSEGRILDPTCGTGTFLIPILNDRLARLRSRNSSDSGNAAAVQDVLNTVAGIDINPVAVTATRVNIVLALGSLAGLGDLTLSVWRADSLLVPDAPPRQGRTTDGQLVGLSFRELRTSLPEPFPVPMLLGSAKRMEVLRRVLEHALVEETADLGVAYVRESLTERFGPDGTDVVTTDGPVWANEIEVAIVLFRQIRQLKDEGRDGVWSQIIANAYAPLFAGRFDVVVGNPPWLAWGRLPVQWRAGSEKLWRKYGLWKLPVEPGDTRGVFQVSDLCQLVFAIAIERYAVEQGWVGLLTPQSLLIANPGARAFRKCRLVSGEDFDGDPVDIPFDIVSVDDWSNLQPFAPLASNKPVFIVAHKGHDQQYPVTGHRWTRTVERTVVDGDWSNAKKSVTDTIGTYAPANPGVRTSAWSFRPDNSPDMLTGGENGWDFGIGLHTRGANGVYFVDVISSNSSTGTVEVENLPSEGRNAKVVARRARIESDFVYPLLRGKDVVAWHSMPSIHCVIPHDPKNFDNVLSSRELKPTGSYPALGRWLNVHKQILKMRKTPPTRNWKMEHDDWCRIEGPLSHMRGKHLVVVREIAGRPAAAIVERRHDTELNRSESPVIDHKLLFCSVSTQDEALYLSAFINSTPAQDLLCSFANSIGVTPKALKTLPIPPFDTKKEAAQTLVEAGRKIMTTKNGPKRSTEILVQQPIIDQAVLRLASIDPSTYMPQRKVAPARRPSKSTRSNGGEDAHLFIT